MTRIFWVFLMLCTIQLSAQPEEVKLDSSLYENRGAVILEDDTLFFLYDQINGINARERASLVNLRLENLVHGRDLMIDSFSVENSETYSRVLYKGDLITNITTVDASWYGSTPAAMATTWASELRDKCQKVHSQLDIKSIITQILLALLVIIISAVVIRYVNRLFKFFALRIQRLKGRVLKGVNIRGYELLNQDRLVSIARIVVNFLRIIVLIIIFYLTLPVVLKIFPWTEPIADTLFGFILNPLKAMIMGIVAYIPNIFTILVIYFVIRYIIKAIFYLAEEVRTEKLKLTNFYPDWAIPTARVMSFILYAFMLVLIWPYLPGSDSAVFQGVSVFLGVLLTLGSSSAIGNIVAGLVITYMRPYQIGHRVRVGEVWGDVVEKNLLITRIRTIKNEVVTVPNSNILNNSSINYSSSSERSEGLILHTSVTIGYDVPWRLVHKMLIEAAQQTPQIEANPDPFVLQMALDDFYVKYQINAYTRAPEKQTRIYSDLHALIQDIFAKNKVEIMSPHYRAYREGPDTTPEANGS